MRTNRILSAALVACGAIGLSTSAHATNGYQLIGVGAYQKGMGGAVTCQYRTPDRTPRCGDPNAPGSGAA